MKPSPMDWRDPVETRETRALNAVGWLALAYVLGMLTVVSIVWRGVL